MLGIKKAKTERRVAILGAGPAGVLAAQAAYERGYDPVIFSRPPLGDRLGEVAKSELHGCQYLHAPVPSPTFAGGAGTPVRYLLKGSSDGYRTKVYGPDARVAVSPDEYGQAHDHMAWDLRHVYDKLFTRWQPKMRPINITAEEVKIACERGAWRAVLSTIPAPSICYDPAHRFDVQPIWAMGQRDGGPQLPVPCDPFTVVCNGERDTGWYRVANVFGMQTVEWPDGRKPPIKGVVQVEKPIGTNCTCHISADAQATPFLRIGRFGKWQKGVLVHTAYTETKALLP